MADAQEEKERLLRLLRLLRRELRQERAAMNLRALADDAPQAPGFLTFRKFSGLRLDFVGKADIIMIAGKPADLVSRKVVEAVFRGMLQRFSASMRRFMTGRYGVDQLNIFLLVTAVILSVVSMLLSRFGAVCRIISLVVNLISYGILGWYLFRFLSRNPDKRFLENRRYLELKARLLRGGKLRAWMTRLTDRQHRYFRCPSCRQTVRVPRGRGKISIRCPRCSEKFIRKS